MSSVGANADCMKTTTPVAYGPTGVSVGATSVLCTILG